MMKRRASCIALMAASLMGAPLGCSPEIEEAETVIRPVRHLQVLASGSHRTRSFSGTSRAGAETNLSFRVAGRIDRLDVSVGQAISKNDTLARLDPTDLDLQVQEARASLSSAQAEARQAEAENDRIRKLYESDNASKSEFDRSRAAASSAEAGVRVSARRLELANRQLSYTRLEAPVDGLIASVEVEANENVNAGQPVVMLTSGDTPEVEVAIPESVITRIHEGDEVTVSFDALPDEELAAVVTEVGVAAVAAGSTYPVTARLIASHESVRSGMAATVHFRLSTGQTEATLRVPPVSVGEDRAGRFVFVLKAGAGDLATAERRAVEVGKLSPDGLAITAGLEENELIATAGVRRLTEGQTVRLLPEHRE